jgi:hypothetical protein
MLMRVVLHAPSEVQKWEDDAHDRSRALASSMVGTLSSMGTPAASQPKGKHEDGKSYEPVGIPIPMKADVLGALERAAKRPAENDGAASQL